MRGQRMIREKNNGLWRRSEGQLLIGGWLDVTRRGSLDIDQPWMSCISDREKGQGQVTRVEDSVWAMWLR